MSHPDTYAVVHFKDEGQDFLQWQVAKDGRVLDSHPYQKDVWSRCHVVNLSALKPGAMVEYITERGDRQAIRYPVQKVVTAFNHYAIRRGRAK